MKKIVVIVYLSLIGLNVFAGDKVNNGGGFAEQNFVYVYQNLRHFMEPCLDINPCNLTEKEDRVLRDIAYGMEVREGRGNLIFKSGKLNPGLFEVDETGKPRVAVTSSDPGSPIYINLDIIYYEEDGEKKSLPTLTAVSILVHELGHHYGIKDHLFLDKLGNKVKTFREQFVEHITLKKYKQEKFSLKAYNHSFRIEEYTSMYDGVQGKLIIENGYDLFDLTEAVTAKLVCPENFRVVGLHFSNMHWKKMQDFDSQKNIQPVSMVADLGYKCRVNSPTELGHKNLFASLEISADFRVMVENNQGKLVTPSFKGHEWVYYPESILDLVKDSLKLDLSL